MLVGSLNTLGLRGRDIDGISVRTILNSFMSSSIAVLCVSLTTPLSFSQVSSILRSFFRVPNLLTLTWVSIKFSS